MGVFLHRTTIKPMHFNLPFLFFFSSNKKNLGMSHVQSRYCKCIVNVGCSKSAFKIVFLLLDSIMPTSQRRKDRRSCLPVHGTVSCISRRRPRRTSGRLDFHPHRPAQTEVEQQPVLTVKNSAAALELLLWRWSSSGGGAPPPAAAAQLLWRRWRSPLKVFTCCGCTRESENQTQSLT